MHGLLNGYGKQTNALIKTPIYFVLGREMGFSYDICVLNSNLKHKIKFNMGQNQNF